MRAPDDTAPAPRSSTRRLAAVDAARGCAMVMVCASHIKHHFVESAPTLYWLLLTTTRMATVTFLLLSGFVIAHLLRTAPDRRVQLHLIDRGLFLLIVAHLLLGLTDLPAEGGFAAWLLGRSEITDAIGVALFAAVLLRAASAPRLLALGASMALASWIIAMTATAHADWTRMLGAVLFHLRGAGGGNIDAPLVPYLGVFLLGMALSVRLEKPLLARDEHALARRLFVVGGVAVAIVTAGLGFWQLARPHLPAAWLASDTYEFVRHSFDPRHKWPPGPAYILFYGAVGVLLTAFLFRTGSSRLVAPFVRVASVIGRASLMCFVVQDLLFFGAPRVFGFEAVTSPAFWLTYLGGCVLLLYALARAWDAVHGNRFLTVGLKLALEPLHAPGKARAGAASPGTKSPIGGPPRSRSAR